MISKNCKVINQFYYNTNSTLFNVNNITNLLNTNNIAYRYIKAKDIQTVKQQNKHLGAIKTLSKVISHILSQILAAFKVDWKQFKRIRTIPQVQRTIQDRYLYRQIRLDLIKFGPAMCIFNVPFGFPLFYIYLRFFPELIPSWMMIDTFHQKISQGRKQKKNNAYKYYFQTSSRQLGLSMIKQTIYKPYQQLSDLRRISDLCLGYYQDGTFYISSKTGIQFSKGLFFQQISKQIIKQKLLKQIANDYQNQGEYLNLSNEQKIYKKACIQANKMLIANNISLQNKIKS